MKKLTLGNGLRTLALASLVFFSTQGISAQIFNELVTGEATNIQLGKTNKGKMETKQYAEESDMLQRLEKIHIKDLIEDHSVQSMYHAYQVLQTDAFINTYIPKKLKYYAVENPDLLGDIAMRMLSIVVHDRDLIESIDKERFILLVGSLNYKDFYTICYQICEGSLLKEGYQELNNIFWNTYGLDAQQILSHENSQKIEILERMKQALGEQ